MHACLRKNTVDAPDFQVHRPVPAFRAAALASLLVLLAGAGSSRADDVVAPRRLLEMVDIGLPVVSPDGRRVAFRTEQASIERNAWDTVWYVQELEGSSSPRRVADGGVPLRNSAGGPDPASAVWSPDGQWIHYLAFVDGRIDVWRAAADGSGAEALTRDEADVLEFRLGEDGGELLYRTGPSRERLADAERAEYHGGVRVGPGTPIGQNLFRALNIRGGWSTQRYNGTDFNYVPLLADEPPRWKALDLRVRETSDLGTDPRAGAPLEASDLARGIPEPSQLALEPGGRRIALLTRVGQAQGMLEPPDVQLSVLEDRSDRRPVACTAESCTGKLISNIVWRPGSDEVVFIVTDPDAGLAQSVFRWNVRSGEVHPVVASRGLLSGGNDRFSSCGVSDAHMVCVASEADRPPRLERIGLDTGSRHVLFDPNESLAADMARAAPARLLRWEDEAGNVYTGQFFEAKETADGPAPLFVTYYRCAGFLRGGVGDEWPLASLAGHGISALCINAPPGYALDALERYDRALSAVRTVVDLLSAEGKVDRSRVGMGGLSFGSEVTFWTAMHSNLLAAASIASPSIEPNYFLFFSLRDDRFFEIVKRNWGLEPPGETRERWKAVSPIHHLDRMRAPMLFQMPEQEYLFSLGVTLPLVRRMQADFYVFPHEAHVKFQPRHKLAVYERNLDWFRFWLQGREDAHPDKAEQYGHWRAMRAALEGDST